MSEKTFKIVNGDISDGYHTFDELYEHRCLLFITLWQTTLREFRYMFFDHFPDWDLLVVRTPEGQISYHVPAKYRLYYRGKSCSTIPYEFDGHTSKDVVRRLEKLAETRAEK